MQLYNPQASITMTSKTYGVAKTHKQHKKCPQQGNPLENLWKESLYTFTNNHAEKLSAASLIDQRQLIKASWEAREGVRDEDRVIPRFIRSRQKHVGTGLSSHRLELEPCRSDWRCCQLNSHCTLNPISMQHASEQCLTHQFGDPRSTIESRDHNPPCQDDQSQSPLIKHYQKLLNTQHQTWLTHSNPPSFFSSSTLKHPSWTVTSPNISQLPPRELVPGFEPNAHRNLNSIPERTIRTVRGRKSTIGLP